MSLVHTLQDEIASVSPGQFQAGRTDIQWNADAITIAQMVANVQLDQLELNPDNITSLQLARSEQIIPPSWIKRLFGAREGRIRQWVLAQLRGTGGQRLRLCAEVQDATLLEGLPERQKAGLEMELDPLIELLKAARVMGAEVAQVLHNVLDESAFQQGTGSTGVVVEEARLRYAPPLEEGERYRDRVVEVLRERGFLELYQHLSMSERGSRNATRELNEVNQRISIWDRLMFFSDTPDEERARSLKAQIKNLDAQHHELERELDPLLESVGEDFPPLGIGRALERIQNDIHEAFFERRGIHLAKNRSKRHLLRAIDTLTERILSCWLPDFDIEWLIDQLHDKERCKRASEDAPKGQVWTPEPWRGVMPLTLAELMPAMAKSLIDHGYFDQQLKYEQQRAEYRKLTGALVKARKAVSWWHKINIFNKSKDEAERDVLENQHSEAYETLLKNYEGCRIHLHIALSVFPPLALYQRLVELGGIVSQLDVVDEHLLSPSGEVVVLEQLTPGALLGTSIQRACDTLPLAFDGLKTPNVMLAEATVGVVEPGPVSHYQRLLEQFLEALDASHAPHFRKAALHHALMIGSLNQELATVSNRVSFIDKLVFWSSSEDETRVKELEERLEWHHEQASRHWKNLFVHCHQTAIQLPPFALRDWAIAGIGAIAAIHTDGGSSSTPRNCSVYGRDKALQALRSIRDILSNTYGLTGNRSHLLSMAYKAQPQQISASFDSASYFQPLTPGEVASLLAHHLQNTPFKKLYKKTIESQSLASERSREHQEVKAAISIWDRINIFKTTDAERRNKELKSELKSLHNRHGELYEQLLDVFHKALEQYPPARLYFEVERVLAAVNDISAYCASYTVTTGSGNNRRTETRYECRLSGKGTAIDSMRVWAAHLVSVFGSLPGYHELLRMWGERSNDPKELDAYRWQGS